ASRAPEVRREALGSAMAAARADAEALAVAAGGRLGELLEASTSGLHEPPMPRLQMARGMEADMSTPISPGEQEVVGTVVVRWRFVPGR
ncbi:MAG: SIMPL domain-containing protein, partial [Gemmatimonadetes bacterium]|nr:SIMPL domain-containing protein [Gemmatimonadota bacterium]